jgi:hypothetical protein
MKGILSVVYIVLVFPSLLLGALVWERVAVDKLFYCWDGVGVPGDFIPPFVHEAEKRKLSERQDLLEARRSGRVPLKDYYFIAPGLVYLIWALHIIVAVALPAILFWIAAEIFNWKPGQKH